ncbi:hypothetical protein DBR06_SOUSAS20010076, partial [Sousa chinensis]
FKLKQVYSKGDIPTFPNFVFEEDPNFEIVENPQY